MNSVLLTKIIIIITFIFAVIYNIFIKIYGTGRSTISKIILDTSTKYPSLAFIFGTMVGHWLYPFTYGEEPYWKYSMFILVPIVLIMLIYDFVWHLPSLYFPINYFMIGVFIGHYGWPQKIIK